MAELDELCTIILELGAKQELLIAQREQRSYDYEHQEPSPEPSFTEHSIPL